MEGRGN